MLGKTLYSMLSLIHLTATSLPKLNKLSGGVKVGVVGPAWVRPRALIRSCGQV